MRVALVDSTRKVSGSVLGLLEAQGHEVLRFADARKALETIQRDPQIDSVIANEAARPISGVELCWEVRLLAARRRPIYIMLMAPSGDLRTKIEALDSGADDVIEMPAVPDELFARLRVAEKVLSLQRELVREASTDSLSGVYTRRAFFDQLTAACHEFSGSGSLAVILIDVDRFKSINDTYGHDVGDQTLRAIAEVTQGLGAPVGRLGGDEFGVILKDHNLDRALEVAARLQEGLSHVRLKTVEGIVGGTCSLGVSEFQPGDTVDDLMKRADLGLYQAKDKGGSSVATAPSNSWMNGRPRMGVSLARLLPRPVPEARDRRNRHPASDGLLGRICAVLDLLIASGLSEDSAAEILAQRLTAAGVPPPKNKGSKLSWARCLLRSRSALRRGVIAHDTLRAYQNVVAAIEAVAPHERVEWVLINELWDRRRAPTWTPRNDWKPLTSNRGLESDHSNLITAVSPPARIRGPRGESSNEECNDRKSRLTT